MDTALVQRLVTLVRDPSSSDVDRANAAMLLRLGLADGAVGEDVTRALAQTADPLVLAAILGLPPKG